MYDFVISVCALGYLESLAHLERAVRELIRIAAPGAAVSLCVFTESPTSLKSLRIVVPKSWWRDTFLSSAMVADVDVADIPLAEFEGRYNVWITKMFVI